MKSTADFAVDERPKNWREGILRNDPRNRARLYALTAAMKSKSTDDPEFAWWAKDVDNFVYNLGGAINNAVTTIPLVKGGLMLKPGDTLRINSTGEVLRVTVITSDTSIEVQRAFGPGGHPSGTAAAALNNAAVIYVGSAYREGAPRSIGTSRSPTKFSNFTQIFRTPIEMTRTAMQTKLRTGDGWAENKKDALDKHAIGIERAFFFGAKRETLENNQPLRTTGGFLDFIPVGNQQDVGATTDMDELEALMPRIFAYGSSEKLAWGSINSLMIINSIVRKNAHYQLVQGEKEFGINVTKLVTPAGVLTFMEHPLFNIAGGGLEKDVIVMDTADMRYRYLQDTILRKDIQNPGDDGKCDEYLTEAGLEVTNPENFFWVKNLTAAAKDA